MAVNKILYLALPIILTYFYVAANEVINATVKCQSGRSLRKQVSVEPLNGMCLRDVVVYLSKKLQSIVDEELGVSSFQDKIDKMEYANISSNLDARLNALVDKFNNKLRTHIDVLKQGYNAIYSILSKEIRTIYSSQTVDLDMMQNRVSDICSEIITEFATKLRGQEWKNLHVLPISQPSMICGPPILAHIIGSLLLSQYCPEKNVILLLEHGIFMSESDLVLAQIAAKTVIDMLSETDNVTVIGLANTAPLFCKDSLLKATDINKFQLARYVDSLNRTDSNQTTMIDFRKLTQNLRHEVVIIHLTNKLKDTSNVQKIFEIISERLKTYLKTILILSDQQSHVSVKQPLNNDVIILPTQNILGYEIGKLFSCLQCSDYHKKDFYISDPYFDLYSKTMTLSIGQITSTALLSLDVKLCDFLDDITYFNAGPNIYVIFFDNKGVVWMHKNFPRIETIIEQPLKVHLQDIENIDNWTVMKMINETQGVINVKTKLDEQKRYRWKHLHYDDLIICLVSTTEEGVLPVARTVSSLPTNILHHRLDLMLQTVVDKDTLCTYRNRIVTLSTGVVYLSPWCFQSPMEQLELLETGSAMTVQSYMAYIKDLTGLLANPGLHPSVKPDVATLAQVLEHFKKQHIEGSLNKFVIRRYAVSTVSGVLEIFPGMVLDSGFDPKRRMWYGKALEYPDKIILTPPYLDAGGSGYVVTLSQVVKYSVGNKSKDYVIAVLSMDVTISYIMRLLVEMFPFCYDATVKCFLMDDKGYLVSHPTLLEATGKIEQQHLTHKELLVANDILNHGLFVKKKSCANHLEGIVQRYYQFNMSLDDVLTNIAHGEHCVRYQVAAVPGTNVFLGVVNVTTQCNLLRAFCPCSTMDHSCLNCKSMEQTGCECPCECSLYSSSCTQQSINNLNSCSPLYEQGSSLQTPWIQPTNLKSCPSVDCKSYTTERECLGVADCQWCHIDTDGETSLQQPFCSDMSICFKGIFGSLIPYSDGTYNSHSTDEVVIGEWPSVGLVAGGVLALVLILSVILFCYRLRSVNSGVEHQCLHLHTSPDTLRMTHLEGDLEPAELDQTKSNLDSLVRDNLAPISPYRVSTNYRRPPGGDSDHGYSTMTPHDDSEQQTFASEPLLVVDNNIEPDLTRQSGIGSLPSPTTYLGSPHHVLAPVTVHRDMETNYC
ncbi:VWFA and cache domain-containing protein 1 [Anoplolepis gracilipes]|uniref:VWFA and cache domain-containing protein 1 n=1 Tax=Anoplolepis gracilipes TaxID=354296 RepID=UPI003B9EB50E